MDVLHLRGVDLCITQSNIMSYLKKTGEFGPNIDARLAYIAKLYNEEMHVLAGPGIKSIQDLNGKKVNFSDVGSGTQFSTRLIFELLGIKVQEVNVDQADGFQRVKSGEIAATILIAGKPTGSFGKFKLEPGMTLLPVPYIEALEQDYFPAKLTQRRLPQPHRQGQLRRHHRHRRRARLLQLAARTPTAIAASRCSSTPSSRKFPEFQKPARHSKWKEANLASTLRGWKRFPAAEEWLAKNADRQAAAGPVQIDPAIARAQAAKAAPNDPAEQERLFQQFMEWAKSQKR